MITLVRFLLWIMLAVLPNGRLPMPDGTTVIDHCGALSLGQTHLVCLTDHNVAIVVTQDDSYIAYDVRARQIDF
jgi:hypothetical protein